MKDMAGPYLSWTNIDQEIKQAVRSCGSCQQVRKPPAVAPLTPWLWSSNPWYRVHITLRTKMGITLLSLTHILAGLMIYFVRRNISATTTIAILRELFAKYGLPVHCVIENSPQFRSEELAHFMKVNGVKRRCKCISCLQINVVIISDKIFKTKIFKCDSINVFTIGESTRCCEWRLKVIVFLFGCHPSTYEKGTLFFIFSEVYSCLLRLRFPGWNN